MKRKFSMSQEPTTIHDLPDEMLEHVLSFLNIDDCEVALQVCRRWSELKPCSHWSSVQLVVNFYESATLEANYQYHQTLLASSRQYKHLVVRFGYEPKQDDLLVDIVEHFHRKMETLELTESQDGEFPFKLSIFERVMALCSNLRYLDIDIHIFDSSSRKLDVSPMYKLKELCLRNDMISYVPNMKDIMPNITRLSIAVGSEEALAFVRHFSSQLVDLDIFVHSVHDCFEKVCDMQFPLLETIGFRGTCAYEPIVRFFRQLPRLKHVTHYWRSMDDLAIQALCGTYVNVQYLRLCTESIGEDGFRAICELKQLWHLSIQDAKIEVPNDSYKLLWRLQIFAIQDTYIADQARFSEFVRRAFPRLRTMKMLELTSKHEETQPFEVLNNICNHLPWSLQRIEIVEISEPEDCPSLPLGEFLKFCATRARREVKLTCWDITDDQLSESEIPSFIPVERLILDVPDLLPDVLRKLVGLMTQLRCLELKPGGHHSPEVISSLRKEFPKCGVVIDRKASDTAELIR